MNAKQAKYIVLVVKLVLMFGLALSYVNAPKHNPNAAVPADNSYSQMLFEENNCWRNDGKTHPYPTGVLMLADNLVPEVISDQPMVDVILEEVLAGQTKVIAFCKK